MRKLQPSTVYVLFNLLFGLSIGFNAPGYAPFLQSIGITMPQIALINVVFFLTIVVGELPTGMLADGRSRAWSVRIGVILAALGHLLYSFVGGLGGAIGCEALIGLGMTFMSGALEAWVADAVGQGEERLRRVFGGGALSLSIGTLLGGVFGALVTVHDLRTGFWFSALAGFGAFLIALTLMGNRGEPTHRVSEWTALKNSLSAVKNGNGLVWALAAAAAFGLVLSFNHYWSLFFRARVGQAGLSLVWPTIYCGSTIGSFIVRRYTKCRGRESLAVVGAMIATGFGMVAICCFGGLTMPLICAFIHEVGRGAFKPLLDVFVQRRVQSSYRATYSSLQSLVGRAGYALVLVAVWLLTRGLPSGEHLILITWSTQGALLMLAAIVLWFFRPARKI